MVQGKPKPSTLSRDSILESIRNGKPQAVPLPLIEDLAEQPVKPVEQFLQRLAEAGGTGHLVTDEHDLEPWIRKLYPEAKHLFTNIPGLEPLNSYSTPVQQPQAYRALDVAVLQADFGVAENGAVWITDASLEHRSVLFLTQHLVLVVPKTSIVRNMFHAYQRMADSRPKFGCFIAGPSKTADIEQTLVLGAHGARTLDVLLTSLPR